MKKTTLGITALLALIFIGNAMLTYAQNTEDVFAYLPFVAKGDEEPGVATPEPTATATAEPGGLNSNYFESYTINDTGFGTEVDVTVDENANTRTIESNALPNHETGEFPNDGNPNTISAQEQSWTFPTDPVFRGVSTNAVVPGVAINGVKFQPNTAERATCDNGEVYNIEAIQDVAGVGLDFNNAHVQPTGAYHYHGVSELLAEAFDNDQDLVHVAFAADGHMIYYSKSGAYSPSYRLGADARSGINCTYTGGGNSAEPIIFGSTKDGSVSSDWDYDASYGDLDECNGMTINGEYVYLITHDYPYVSRCLMGEFTEDAPGSGGGSDGGAGGQATPTATVPVLPTATVPATPTATIPATPTETPGGTNSDYLESYEIIDTGFGTVVTVTVNNADNTRTIESNALPNHDTGEFPNEGNPNTISAQEQTWTFTTDPVFTGDSRGVVITGVAINGVKFQPSTAERATCDNGEVYNLEAIQDVAGVGLDFNNAHVQPTGAYHYHGVSELLVEAFSNDQDLVHVAFAADGHMIYYSKSGAYSPSYRLGADARSGINCIYTPGGNSAEPIIFGSTKDGSVSSDWDYDASYGDLDQCNGMTINGEYIYLITHDYPYVSRCLMGEFTEDAPGSGGGGGGGGGGQAP